MHSLYGNVLKINATVSTQSTSQTPDTVIEKYIGGKGLAVNPLPFVCLDSNIIIFQDTTLLNYCIYVLIFP